MREYKYSIEKQNYIMDQYNLGRTTLSIAEELKTYNTTIRRILIKNNIKLNTASEAKSIVKSDLFSSLDRDTNYWLGLLATDGCITRTNNIVLDLKKSDKLILEKFIIWSGYPIKLLSTYSKKFNYHSRRISFYNVACASTLNKYGITERKSETLKLNIPITSDLLRGIFDGDGCVVHYNKSNSISGVKVIFTSISLEFINQIKEYLKSVGIDSKINKCTKFNSKHKDKYSLNINKYMDTMKFYQHIYDNHNFCLDRKFEKFNDLIKISKINEYTGKRRTKKLASLK